MKTFSHFFIIACIFTSLILTSSCRKDKDSTPPPPAPVTGTWKGSVVGNGNPTPIRFDILDNGTVTVSAQSTQFSGTWKLAANNFEAGFIVEGIKATAKGTLSDSKNKITGTWQENNNGTVTEKQLTLNKD